jgi:Phosphotransferase enzyme family
MTTPMQERLQATDFISLARQVLGKAAVEVLEWQCQRLSAGGSEMSGGLGVYRISGTARDQDSPYPWSLILKITSGSAAGSQEPAAWNYWKREVTAYQSGLLDQLPGSLRAPRCYAIAEYPGDEFWMWLEDVRETMPDWTMEQHHLAARHLGEFNGAYLTGYPLPDGKPWLTRGRTREWTTFAQSLLEPNRQYADTPSTRRLFLGDSFERAYALWSNYQPLLEAFEGLPVCFCHHDAFRRNLFAHPDTSDTIAIDWAIAGFGRVGEEVGMTTANNILWMEVPVSQAKELDQAVFSGYIEGLQTAGWNGDMRLARLGYTANAGLVMGMAWPMFHLENIQNAKAAKEMEAMVGHSFDELMQSWSSAQLFLLDLADEAFKLMDTLK